MNTTAILIVQSLIKYGPEVARAIAAIFQKSDPTPAEWEAVFKLAEKSYDDYVKEK